MSTFNASLDILPTPQRQLWLELSQTPPQFTLYGGTAISLRLGHRQSIDFDFFALNDIDADRLLANVPYLREARIAHREPNTLTCFVDRGGPVKLSFFGVPNLKRIAEPDRAQDTGLPCARLIDLAGTKAQTVQSRAAIKDYIDIEALIRLADLPLANHLSAARHIFGHVFEPMATLKALSYFGDVPELPDAARKTLLQAVQDTDPFSIPPLSAIHTGMRP